MICRANSDVGISPTTIRGSDKTRVDRSFKIIDSKALTVFGK